MSREFELKIPEHATPEEEERLVDEATDREIAKMLDGLGL